MPRKIEISHKTIIFTIAFLIFLWFLFFIRVVILALFVALLIMAILNPAVTRLSRFKVPRGLSVFVVYLLFFGLIGTTLGFLIPPLVEQTTNFANGLPAYLQNLGLSEYFIDQIASELLGQIGNIPSQVVKFGVSILSNAIAVFTVLILAFYLLIARDRLDDQISFFFGDQKTKQIGKILDLLETRLGGWARGQFTLMFLVGLATYIGLSILGIPFSLPLAILAGLLEVVPNIGPIISAIPAVIIGFGISPIVGIAVSALAFLIQQVENYVFVPKVMEKSVGVSPIVTLLSLAVGFKVAGAVGMIISVPAVITLNVLSKELLLTK